MTRSHSPPTHANRCARCAMMAAWCVCEVLPTVHTQLRICVIRHLRELRKPSGTARIAALALPGLEIIDYRDEPGDERPGWFANSDSARDGALTLPPERVAAKIAALPAPCLLSPTGRAVEALIEKPQTLVVLDGTWRQARRMYQRISGLTALPAVRLPEAANPVRHLRRTQGAQRSTLEAIAEVVGAIEDQELGATLLRLHTHFVEHSLRARGRPMP